MHESFRHEQRGLGKVDQYVAKQLADGRTIKIPSQYHGVLVQLLNGLSEKEVATVLKTTVGTVHRRVRTLYKIFKVHSRAELMAKAFVNLLPLKENVEPPSVVVCETNPTCGPQGEQLRCSHCSSSTYHAAAAGEYQGGGRQEA